jgi:hypothetical protein
LLAFRLMLDIAGHTPLTFKLYATGRALTVDGGHLTALLPFRDLNPIRT